jgi:hypothetical protein
MRAAVFCEKVVEEVDPCPCPKPEHESRFKYVQ